MRTCTYLYELKPYFNCAWRVQGKESKEKEERTVRSVNVRFVLALRLSRQPVPVCTASLCRPFSWYLSLAEKYRR